ncbi:MAG: hypothetical protein CL607_18955 [Anaerolineaceae bacterium]|nr:hypothetical protein [Anaerolineaceae bacterium]
MSDNQQTEYERKYRLFTERLKQARIDAGLRQWQVAAIINRGQAYISKCENGDLRIDVIQLLEFAEVYSKPINYFLEGIE